MFSAMTSANFMVIYKEIPQAVVFFKKAAQQNSCGSITNLGVTFLFFFVSLVFYGGKLYFCCSILTT